MQKTRWVVAAAIVVLVAASAVMAEVEWTESSWDEVLASAKSQNQYVFVDFYTTWCGPCKRLDKITYQDAAVVEFLGSTVAVKYDAEKGVGIELAKEYKVGAYPTLVIIGPDGNEVDRHIGYLGPEDFVTVLEGYTRGIGTLSEYEEKLAANPEDLELMSMVAFKYADRAMAEEAVTLFEKIMAADPDDKLGKRAEMIYGMGEVNYDVYEFETARAYFKRLMKEYPDTEWWEDGTRRLAYAEAKLGNNDEAVAAYQAYVDRHPDDPGALNGIAWFCAQRGIGLDVALAAGLKAVKLSNRDPGILDTLAEVYYARGEYDDAIKIGKEARESDPDDQYFNDQVEKFEKAKAEADSQAMR